MMKIPVLYSLYRTVERAHWSDTLWKCFSTIWVIRMDKWYRMVCLDKGNPIHCGLLWRNIPTYLSLFGPETPWTLHRTAHLHWGTKEIPVLRNNLEDSILESQWPPGFQHPHDPRSVDNFPCMLHTPGLHNLYYTSVVIVCICFNSWFVLKQRL